MRVIFMGTPDFAVPTLNHLIEAGHDIVLVVAQPDKPAGRGKSSERPPLHNALRNLGSLWRSPAPSDEALSPSGFAT